MEFGIPEFLGALIMTWFIGVAAVIFVSRVLKVENPAPCWVVGAVTAAALGAIGLSLASMAAGALAAVYFIIMAASGKPPPKLS